MNSPPALRAGDHIAGWVVDGPLGEGQMGTVYRVHSAMGGHFAVALKVLKLADAASRAVFTREAEALSALRHPAIVRVMGFSEDQARGVLCLAMEVAPGETLRQRLASGAMELPEALRTFVPLASALEHAHAHGVYHQDVKPANIMLCPDGPRLVDFGIAHARWNGGARSGARMGTLAYLPPEAFDTAFGWDPAATDVYAFGLLLHEALTGLRVFAVGADVRPARAEAIIAARKAGQGPVDPGEGFPDTLRAIVRGATDRDPARRPAMAVLRTVLESLHERRAARGSATEEDPARRSAAAAVDDHTVLVPDPS